MAKAQIKLIARHGDYTVEVKGKDASKVVVAYQDILIKMQASPQTQQKGFPVG